MINWRKFFAISTVVSILHYGEDVSLIWLGRFTQINFLVLLLFPILFGIIIGALSQLGWVKRYLNE